MLAVIAAGGDAGRSLVHVQQGYAEAGAEPAVPAADLAALTRMEVDGKLTATQAKTVVADLLACRRRRPGGDRGDARASKRSTPRRWSATSPTRSRRSPGRGPSSVAGEQKAAGALVGAVMKASKGKADGKLVTRLLEERRASA